MGSRVCTDCGETDTNTTIPIDKDAHVWGEVEEGGKKPTCTEDGEGTRYCTLNSSHTPQTGTIPKLGHDDGEWHTSIEPECEDDGLKELRCTRDQFVLDTEVIGKLGHDWKDVWTVTENATCEDEGEEEDTCNRNASHTRQRIIEALGHEWGDWVVTTAATTTMEGEEKRTCSVCDDIETCPVPKIPTFTVTFNTDGGSTVATINDVEHGNTVSKPTDPTKAYIPVAGLYYGLIPEYYTFNGWFAPGAITEFDFAVPITESITLTAQWSSQNLNHITTVAANDIAEAVSYVSNNANPAGTYTLAIDQNVAAGPQILELTNSSQVTLVITGIGGVQTISNGGNGSLFSLRSSWGGTLTLILDNNITLQGGSGNTASLVDVGGRSVLVMNTGTKIINNAISFDSAYARGGGVSVGSNSTFTMNGGEISGNTVLALNTTVTTPAYYPDRYSHGGGVYVGDYGTFTMNGGKISGNTARLNNNTSNYSEAAGGGVYVGRYGTFTMNGGEISGNTASKGSYSWSGGGGVYVYGAFRMVTGTVYGSSEADTALRNTADNGAALYNRSTTAEHGTFDGTTWEKEGNLTTGNDTIRVIDGVLQQ